MKSKKKSWLVLIVVVLMIAACGYVSAYGYGKDHIGTAKNIKLGLDLAGGVNITYEADEDNPSSEDMNDTVYKLQQRVEAWSTEAEVYQEGTNRVNVDIPGVYDAEKILSELGNPGSISFCEAKSDAATGKEVLDGYCEVVGGEGIKSAQATSQKDSYGNTQYVVSLMAPKLLQKQQQEISANRSTSSMTARLSVTLLLIRRLQMVSVSSKAILLMMM